MKSPFDIADRYLEKPEPEVMPELPLAPACWNCGATMTKTQDIYGKPWWACWACAKKA
jgi:hypothetical protein